MRPAGRRIGPKTHHLAQLDEGRAQVFHGETDALVGSQVAFGLLDLFDEPDAGELEPFHQIVEPIFQQGEDDVLETADRGERPDVHLACVSFLLLAFNFGQSLFECFRFSSLLHRAPTAGIRPGCPDLFESLR